MYSHLIKSEAFVLFCQGLSFRSIADRVRGRAGCEKLTHSTIRKWADETDENGESWEYRKQECMKLVKQDAQEVVIRSQEEIIRETDFIISSIIDELKGESLEFKTKDSAIYAFKALSEWQKRITDEKKKVAIEDQVQLFVEAMHEIPEVSKVLLEHNEEINQRFQVKAVKLLRSKRHGE